MERIELVLGPILKERREQKRECGTRGRAKRVDGAEGRSNGQRDERGNRRERMWQG